MKSTPNTSHNDELRAQMERYCRERDETAFRAFYDACKSGVLRIAVHLCGRGDHAYDLSQEIWVKLWKNLCGFRGESKIMSWVYRIAMTTYLDKKAMLVGSMKTAQKSSHKDSQKDSQSGADSPRAMIRAEIALLENTGNDAPYETDTVAPPDGHNPETSAETASAQALVERALERLTPGERTVFVAKHFHDLTFKEIAAELGTHEGTAKTLHFRALKKLQQILAVHYPELRGEIKPSTKKPANSHGKWV